MKITSVAVVLVVALVCLFLFTRPALGEGIAQRQKRRIASYTDIKGRFRCNKYGYRSSACRVVGDDVLLKESAKARYPPYEIRGHKFTAQECSDAKVACVGAPLRGLGSKLCTLQDRFTLKECARLFVETEADEE